MRWEEFIFTGVHAPYKWGVSHKEIKKLKEIITQHFNGLHACCPLGYVGSLSASEQDMGWFFRDGMLISPPLRPGLELITSDENFEWYLFEKLPGSFPLLEQFRSWGAINLAKPDDIYAAFDPSWDPKGHDWLIPIQERFWEQIELLRPVAYVMVNGTDVVVSTQPEFVDECMKNGAENPRTRR